MAVLHQYIKIWTPGWKTFLSVSKALQNFYWKKEVLFEMGEQGRWVELRNKFCFICHLVPFFLHFLCQNHLKIISGSLGLLLTYCPLQVGKTIPDPAVSMWVPCLNSSCGEDVQDCLLSMSQVIEMADNLPDDQFQ